MAPFEAARITERAVLRILVAGFALVVTVLGWSGLVAVRGTRAIEQDAARVGQEQLAMVRLLNDMQAGQNSMAAVLSQLAPGAAQAPAENAGLLEKLRHADEALSRIGAAAGSTPEAAEWRQLASAMRNYSSSVRVALEQKGPLSAGELAKLFAQHQAVMRVEQSLLAASEERMEATERLIESESRELAANARILFTICLVLALLCATVTLIFARHSIRKMEWQASELSRVSWHMLQSQESLARRFSHELHDELGQSLAAIKSNLSSTNSAEWPARRQDCIGLVDQAIANTRDLSQLLHPVVLDDFGLDAALRWLTEGFAQRTGVETSYRSTYTGRTETAVETHLFRIAQEALTNVARHSGATRLQVELLAEPPNLRLVITDNGRGLHHVASPAKPSLGMTGMRARAEEIGAEFRLGVPPAGGLRLVVDVPLPPTTEQDAAEENHHRIGR